MLRSIKACPKENKTVANPFEKSIFNVQVIKEFMKIKNHINQKIKEPRH